MRRSIPLILMSIFIGYFGGMACGGSGGNNACDPVAQTGCAVGQVCEQVTDGTTACFSPVTLRGTVIDPATGQPIAGARVVALDANGSAASNVAITDALGNYELEVFSTRDTNGDPVSTVFLRADAAGFQTFPGGVRPPFPVDLSAAIPDGDGFLLDNSLTQLQLLALAPGFPTGSIEGNVELPPDRLSVLVVAELENGDPCPALNDNDCTAIAGEDGAFKIFNLPAGNYLVKVFVQGSNYSPVAINLANGQAGLVGTLALNGNATATLTGKVNIVNPGIGNETSVVLVVKSTLLQINSGLITDLPILIRGPTPPGLRVANVSGDFTLEGIPEGTYVVLAGFENDNLVRDPDICIAGTDILEQTFTVGQVVDVSNNPFKITGALDDPTPTGNAITTATPTFTWDDDSGEDNFLISVTDSFGNIMWEFLRGNHTGGETVSEMYDSDGLGLPLTPGFYQFHVYSISDPTGGCPVQHGLSQTEDFLGTFEVQ